MRSMHSAAAVPLLLAALSAGAQVPSQAADHDALRKMKADLLSAVNGRKLESLEGMVHQPFVATLITQQTFTDIKAMKAFYEDLFTRKLLRLSKVTVDAEADELSQIYTGTFAVARGSTSEVYEMADGRRFDMKGRWTAVALKDGEQWKLLALHNGTNFLDNPVLTAVEKSTVSFGIGGVVLGLILGVFLGFLVGRRRS